MVKSLIFIFLFFHSILAISGPTKYYLKAELNRNDISLYEGVDLKIFLIANSTRIQTRILKFPKLENFFKRFYLLSDDSPVELNKKNEFVKSLKYQARVFPIKKGKLLVDALELEIEFVDKDGVSVKKNLKSNEIELDISDRENFLLLGDVDVVTEDYFEKTQNGYILNYIFNLKSNGLAEFYHPEFEKMTEKYSLNRVEKSNYTFDGFSQRSIQIRLPVEKKEQIDWKKEKILFSDENEVKKEIEFKWPYVEYKKDNQSDDLQLIKNVKFYQLNEENNFKSNFEKILKAILLIFFAFFCVCNDFILGKLKKIKSKMYFKYKFNSGKITFLEMTQYLKDNLVDFSGPIEIFLKKLDITENARNYFLLILNKLEEKEFGPPRKNTQKQKFIYNSKYFNELFSIYHKTHR